MLRLTVCLLLLVTLPAVMSGYAGLHAGPIFHEEPIFSAPILPAPTIFKSYSPPILPAPIFKAPLVYASPPIIKTIAPVPVVKHVVPAATSYAAITKYISHPVPISVPVIKTVVASPPILKSYAYAAEPIPFHGFGGFHH